MKWARSPPLKYSCVFIPGWVVGFDVNCAVMCDQGQSKVWANAGEDIIDIIPWELWLILKHLFFKECSIYT